MSSWNTIRRGVIVFLNTQSEPASSILDPLAVHHARTHTERRCDLVFFASASCAQWWALVDMPHLRDPCFQSMSDLRSEWKSHAYSISSLWMVWCKSNWFNCLLRWHCWPGACCCLPTEHMIIPRFLKAQRSSTQSALCICCERKQFW